MVDRSCAMGGDTRVTLPALKQSKRDTGGDADNTSGYTLLHRARSELTSLKRRAR